MMYSRRQKGEGKDMGGKRTMYRKAAEPTPDPRVAGMDTNMLSPLERKLAKGETGKDGIFHTGAHGAPTIYKEKPGGRKGTKGTRG